MVQVLIVELGRPLDGLVLADRRAEGDRAPGVVVVARLLGEPGRRVLLLRVPPELLRGQRAGELLLVVHVAEVEADGGAPGELVAGGAVGAVSRLLAVVPVALQLGVAEARIQVERAVYLAGADVALEEAVGAALDAALDEAGVVARLGDEVDGAAQGVAAEAERVGALEDLDVLGGLELERLEVAEAVRVAVREAVDQDVDPALVEVVAEARAADGELALVGGAEARADEHAGHDVEHVLEVRRRATPRWPSGGRSRRRRACGRSPRAPAPRCGCARAARCSTRRPPAPGWAARAAPARRRRPR